MSSEAESPQGRRLQVRQRAVLAWVYATALPVALHEEGLRDLQHVAMRDEYYHPPPRARQAVLDLLDDAPCTLRRDAEATAMDSASGDSASDMMLIARRERALQA